MIGLYFSGTGNTRHAVRNFVNAADADAKCFSIEDDVKGELLKHDRIVFGFPVYYSNVPKIVKDYIEENRELFAGKKIILIATKGLFNSYAMIRASKEFKKCGAAIAGSLQLKMPDNIRDLKIMEIAFDSRKDSATVEMADKKIDKAAKRLVDGKRMKSGFGILNYVIGFVLRILPFYPKTDKYKQAPKIDTEKCSGCGLCAEICPKKNLKMENEKAVSGENCTLCYRCFSRCPNRALTILGKKVYNQYHFAGNDNDMTAL